MAKIAVAPLLLLFFVSPSASAKELVFIGKHLKQENGSPHAMVYARPNEQGDAVVIHTNCEANVQGGFPMLYRPALGGGEEYSYQSKQQCLKAVAALETVSRRCPLVITMENAGMKVVSVEACKAREDED